MDTIYQKAKSAINEEIERYLDLLSNTNSLDKVLPEHLTDLDTAKMFAAGMDIIFSNREDYPNQLVEEWSRKSALKFDVEQAVTIGVYENIRSHAVNLYDRAQQITQNFSKFDSDTLYKEPFLLPVFQNILGISKAQLRKRLGSLSDTGYSKPAASRLAEALTNTVHPTNIKKGNILQRLEVTLEGIVRDLVGRILFEEVVANALTKESVPFLREEEYSGLSGVIYDIRADFVIPNEKNPIAFIEVRKSSSRHASLYAKDKMFSAINWKGKHKKIIGVIIVEGDWTQSSLKTMARIFDYVIPLNKSRQLAETLKRAVDGDESVLKWLVEFSITQSPNFKR